MKTRIFIIIFTAANLGLILYGILVLLQPEILFETFLAHIYEFPVERTTVTTYLSALYRLLGYLNIITGAIGLIIIQRYSNTGQKWLLKTIIPATALTYFGPIVFDNTVGTIGFFEIVEHILFVSVIIMGYIMLRHSQVEVS